MASIDGASFKQGMGLENLEMLLKKNILFCKFGLDIKIGKKITESNRQDEEKKKTMNPSV